MVRYYNKTAKENAPNTANALTRIEGLGLNRFNLYDYAVITKTFKLPSSGSSGAWTTTGGYFWLPWGYNSDGSLYSSRQYQRRYTHTLSFHLTLATAVSSVNNGTQGSTVYRLGEYLYAAHKIVEATPTQVGSATFGTPY
jgi:hypothetical protein